MVVVVVVVIEEVLVTLITRVRHNCNNGFTGRELIVFAFRECSRSMFTKLELGAGRAATFF